MSTQRYKYRAINANGRTVRGVLAASNENDLYRQLQQSGMELVQCAEIGAGNPAVNYIAGFFAKKVTTRDLIQLFTHLNQMQGAGVPMLDALSDIRDTTENPRLRDIMSEVYREVSEGTSLSEAFAMHGNIFSNLYIALIKAGEETGDLPFAYRELLKYLTWVDEMQSKIKKATRYPMILAFAVVGTVSVMMGYVVPQIVGFIVNIGQALPWYTTALIATSEFFQNYWWAVIAVPTAFYAFHKIMRKTSESYAFQADVAFLNMPVAGVLIRKISIARFCQTFGALYASGVDVMSGLRAARSTVSNLALAAALDNVVMQVQSGATLSQAFNRSGEFPSLVVRMVKIGEESGNLTEVLEKVSGFYTKDVDEAVQGLITSIEPTLTAIMGLMIAWIAAGVFGPIYDMMTKLDI